EEGINDIAEKYLALARQQLNAGNVEQALAMTAFGLEVKPDHRSLHYYEEYLHEEKKHQQVQQAARVKEQKVLKKQQKQAAQQKRATIKRLLALVETQISEYKLTSPEGDNAVDSYAKIQKLYPSNPIVQEGYNRIATIYLNLAKKYLKDEAFDKSMSMVTKGLTISKHPDLLSFKPKIEIKRLEQRRKLDKIKHLLAKAESQFQQNKLVSPKGNNVYETLKEVQVISPRHPMVKQGFNKIADRFLTQVKRKQAKGKQTVKESERLLGMVNMGISLLPRHKGLASYKQELEQVINTYKGKQKAQQRVEKQIVDLLKKAKSQVASGKLLAPFKNNAYHTYEKLIQVAPTDVRVAALKESLVKQTLKVVEKEKSQGKLVQALTHLDEVLAISPNDSASRQVKKSLQKQIAEVARIQVAEQRAAQAKVKKKTVSAEPKAPKVRVFGTF
ncbi:MAG: hypothetical protein HOM11_14085, partial [Methylococcales bacterium]|nr:hypothetical protein [Methylococcales bacterium]